MAFTYSSVYGLPVQDLVTVLVELIWAVNERRACLNLAPVDFKCGEGGEDTCTYPAAADFDKFPILECNTVFTITLDGAPTGGDWSLYLTGCVVPTISSLAIDVSAATLQGQMENANAYGSGNVSVTGADGGPWRVEVHGDYSGTVVPTIQCLAHTLTGDGDEGVSIEASDTFTSRPLRHNMDLLVSELTTSPLIGIFTEEESGDTLWTKESLETDIDLGEFPEHAYNHLDPVFWARLFAACDRLIYAKRNMTISNDSVQRQYVSSIIDYGVEELTECQQRAWDETRALSPTEYSPAGVYSYLLKSMTYAWEYVYFYGLGAIQDDIEITLSAEDFAGETTRIKALSAFTVQKATGSMTATYAGETFTLPSGTEVGGAEIVELDPEDFPCGEASQYTFSWDNIETDIPFDETILFEGTEAETILFDSAANISISSAIIYFDISGELTYG